MPKMLNGRPSKGTIPNFILFKFKWLLAPLLPLSLLYRVIVAVRNFCFDHGIFKDTKLPGKLISVGNLTVGGTGKTPATIFLAKALRDEGWRVAIIAKGYRRQGKGLCVVSDGQQIRADVSAAGDEPLLLAQACEGIPVIVDRRKKMAAAAAARLFSPEVIIVDDGFQHRQLHRHLDVVMIDPSTFLSNPWLLPAGPMREPISALRRADFIILNISDQNNDYRCKKVTELCRHYTSAPIFSGKLKARGWRQVEKNTWKSDSSQLLPLSIIKDQPVMLVSGIARPDRFRRMVETHGGKIQHEMIFADHHAYTAREAREIAAAFTDCDARYILTTTKDTVKLSSLFGSHSLIFRAGASSLLTLQVAFEPEPGFLPAVIEALRAKELSRE